MSKHKSMGAFFQSGSQSNTSQKQYDRKVRQNMSKLVGVDSSFEAMASKSRTQQMRNDMDNLNQQEQRGDNRKSQSNLLDNDQYKMDQFSLKLSNGSEAYSQHAPNRKKYGLQDAKQAILHQPNELSEYISNSQNGKGIKALAAKKWHQFTPMEERPLSAGKKPQPKERPVQIVQQHNSSHNNSLIDILNEDDDICNRPHRKQIEEFVTDNVKSQYHQKLQQLRNQIRQKYMSSLAILKQKKKVTNTLFYFPSQQMANQIQTKSGRPHMDVLFENVVQHINSLMSLNLSANLYQQANRIISDMKYWGGYYWDMKKLQKCSMRKVKDSQRVTYSLVQYPIQVQFNLDGRINVWYQKHKIQPQAMRNNVIQKMALRQLTDKATYVFSEYLKKRR